MTDKLSLSDALEFAELRWKKMPEIRDEFGSLETYLAYIKAEHSGSVSKVEPMKNKRYSSDDVEYLTN